MAADPPSDPTPPSSMTEAAEQATPPLPLPGAARYYPQPGDEALAERVAYSSAGLTKLPADYLYQRLLQRADSPEIAEAFDRLAGGSSEAWGDLIDAIEWDFVHSPATSSLDLLGLELSERFGGYAWEYADYPGGDEGPNEMYAGTLADALDGVTPERRANRTAVSIIVRDEATDDIWEYMLSQWQPVPGEGDWKLNRHAVEAYVQMRDAAAADGVDLSIMSGHRDPKRAAANAAKAGNSFAVASFSSHSLGLAIDFLLPHAEDDGRYQLTTKPMSDVVAMRRSPVHKWLHLHANEFGWYPFQHEPWHWEYNPPGFREVFFADYPGGPPPRGLPTPAEE